MIDTEIGFSLTVSFLAIPILLFILDKYLHFRSANPRFSNRKLTQRSRANQSQVDKLSNKVNLQNKELDKLKAIVAELTDYVYKEK